MEDLYGPRIIAFDPSYTSNPYITHATLADSDRWPELNMPQSPQVSHDEPERPAGFPGAKLKYTQTIMADKSGGLGLRVHGKRASTSKRFSKSGIQVPALQHHISTSTLAQDAASPPSITTKETIAAMNWHKDPGEAVASPPPAKITTESSPSKPEVTIEAPSVNEEAPVQKVVQFVPKFKGADEMERRRRVRMATRLGLNAAAAPPPPPPQPLTLSSSDDDPQPHSSDESPDDSDFGPQTAHDMTDEVDEFDP